ncbi:hypothetical protein O181_045966 [Austropuccinia psidii MF-1]|uniref:Chromo domain-containing protein n=1 Tax=Austropuccinia psidii MF-1 TaxID=1389203 RepID=A0A9Q3DL48_9BASI|nr:hypothetical protein [Austropuccinia psidii MF-1]
MDFQSVLLVIEDPYLYHHSETNYVRSSRYQEILQLLSILKQMERQRGKSDSRTVLHTFWKLIKKLELVQKVVKEKLESEIRHFKRYADRNRTIPPDLEPGDKVWLASKNIKTTRRTKNLLKRWLRYFGVLKKIGIHAYHLKLPQKWKSIHPVFHVSLLEPVKNSTIPNQNQLPPPPVLVEEQEEWEVAQQLDSKLKRGKLWYLSEWKGFSKDSERTT